jgi:predicted CoA-substrate-specific enzyme activase
MIKTHPPVLHLGIDLGSVSAKVALFVPATIQNPPGLNSSDLIVFEMSAGRFYTREVSLSGTPIRVLRDIFHFIRLQIEEEVVFSVSFTGSQARYVAQELSLPHINDVKALARGVTLWNPSVRTILEIGGNVSRYIEVKADEPETMAILDYDHQGECAAGTGSFLDQQAARLGYTVDKVGQLVRETETVANIAGRCSVFAKTDMIHAQQRGYSPGAILKGLCRAVALNYKSSVLRGKQVTPPAAFVGGVAANEGVSDALAAYLNLDSKGFLVPPAHKFFAAIGASTYTNRNRIDLQDLKVPVAISSRNTDSTESTLSLDAQRVNRLREEPYSSSRPAVEFYLGIDIGSVSTNLVVIDQKGQVVDSVYTRTQGRPVEVVSRELLALEQRWPGTLSLAAVGTTGSGRELIGELVGADVIHDEITAHKTGAQVVAQTSLNQDVDTIFEIGGQDSKFISIEKGVVVDFSMNEACAAGTGSFLEEQAEKLGITIQDEFAQLALSSQAPVKMGERCTVFMEKDVVSYLKLGIPKPDIAAGLAYAVVYNYLNRVVRDRRIGDHIFFQGGTAYNQAVAAAFATVLETTITVPPHNGVMGAIGAALLAREARPHQTRFRGFNLSLVDFSIRHIQCRGCSNRCDVQEVTVEGEKTYWGDKCSQRFHKVKKRARATVPDLISFYRKILIQNNPEFNGEGPRIGIPATMYFYDRFPFWQAYFNRLGCNVVTSSETNRTHVTKGNDIRIAEPCFPMIISHGHVAELFEMDVDYLFLPMMINSETPFQKTFSWVCPWGQTFPLVLRNSIETPEWLDKIISPVMRFQDGESTVANALRPLSKKLGVSKTVHRAAIRHAYTVQQDFIQQIKTMGQKVLGNLEQDHQSAIVLLGRPYNIFDPGINLAVPEKLYDQYGVNVIPMEFLTFETIDISGLHENMFWHYGRRILQAATLVGRHDHLHAIYFTNFKCGPDSYIKHFVKQAIGDPFLTLQFDEHSNDAGIMTRCEAFLQGKGLLSGIESETAHHDIKGISKP